MFKSARLCILITILFSFSQTLEVHADFRRDSFPEEIFVMIPAQEKEPLVSKKNKGFINISGQTPRGKERAIIGPTVKDAIFTVYFFSSENLLLKLLEPLEDGL
ncbi:hypothetical protein MNL13_04220 [Bartonella krasnovii]|uniref:Uncharacterized protein n=1 Tax=Bartonella krasnovii TaxID=2267275 RepID=A0ABY3VX66_9HYPH|nr:hypothetical protein [Bartonella krasnovii]UNF29958.1 hypothetical protein MNL13_04220 [Bartonella krasnovii]UNF34833.1 hypothetical protein MNL12_04220 [Bartonella krasnovii]UNF36431.1 hypothetical protein MNL11_04730 [Bartonella krasnovii]UNF43202.1 hypothetical protein MNL07_04575 [Bartonella krasnovii]UNF46392.1 hypothetical protein MNL05_04670 [Bartonella krasnovii]